MTNGLQKYFELALYILHLYEASRFEKKSSPAAMTVSGGLVMQGCEGLVFDRGRKNTFVCPK